MFSLTRTGSVEIDSQHQMLIDILNDLMRITRSQPLNRPDAMKVFGRLTDYAAVHFHYEELAMKSCGYPEAASHFKEHCNFRETLVEIELKLAATEPFAATNLLVFLRDWLLNHIGESDLRLVKFLVKNQEAA